MKKYITFNDKFGNHVCLGCDGAFVSSLKSRQGLLNQCKRFKEKSMKRNEIVTARVYPVHPDGRSAESPMYIFYI